MVHGGVQGVGFRYFLMAEARRLGLKGWVRNRDDGTVEFVAEGTKPHLERLQQAAEQGLDEVVQHRDGRLTEGSASNIWVVRAGRVLGAPRDNLILEGIRYAFIQELCERASIPFETRTVSMDEVRAADELMLSAATREVLPIVELDGRPIGDGRPGPVYRQLRRGYDAAIDAL